MFETLKNYYETNQPLFLVTAIVVAVSIAVGIAVIFAYKAVRKKRADKKASPVATTPDDSSPADDAAQDTATAENEALQNESVDTAVKAADVNYESAPEDYDLPEKKRGDSEIEKFTMEQAALASEEKVAAEKPAPAKAAPKKAEQKPEADKPAPTEDKKPQSEARKAQQSSRYTGKWVIGCEDGRYTATLIASNGEVLLRSESYSALSGVKSGIDTINKNIVKNNFALSIDKNGKYFFKLYSSSTRLLCISEVYSTKTLCENAMESTKRFSKTAVIVVEK